MEKASNLPVADFEGGLTKNLQHPVKYVAELAHVREVWLLGAADLAFWKDQLQEQGLFPTESEGEAKLLISATESKYMGIRFRELCISVFVSRREAVGARDGFYLAQAFNSSRFFAFVERNGFSTPYEHAAIALGVSHPAFMQVANDGKTLFRAQMSAEGPAAGRDVLRTTDEHWEGPIYLPGNKRTEVGKGKYFFAKLSGIVKSHPFSPVYDALTLNPSASHPIFRQLLESGFVGKEWGIRENATHARSKTFRT